MKPVLAGLRFLSIMTFAVFFASSAVAGPVQRVFVIIFENENAGNVQDQPFFGSLIRQGAYLTNYHALGHPSQPNYVGLIAGDTMGVGDDFNHNLSGKNLADLIEAKGLNWKAYLEAYPGNCFTGTKGTYARKHNPFISFTDIRKDKARCNAHLVNSSQLDTDIEEGNLPEYSFYVPDLNDDGHDTGLAYADKWFSKAFGARFKDSKFMDGTVVAVTFDEDDSTNSHNANLIYTLFFGAGVKAGASSNRLYGHYSLLKTVEEIFGLSDLGRHDVDASAIDDIWQ